MKYAVGTSITFAEIIADASVSLVDKRRLHNCLLSARTAAMFGGGGAVVDPRTGEDARTLTTITTGGTVYTLRVVDAVPLRAEVKVAEKADAMFWITYRFPWSKRRCLACYSGTESGRSIAVCPCGMADYCDAGACQRRDWNSGGHAAVHRAMCALTGVGMKQEIQAAIAAAREASCGRD